MTKPKKIPKEIIDAVRKFKESIEKNGAKVYLDKSKKNRIVIDYGDEEEKLHD